MKILRILLSLSIILSLQSCRDIKEVQYTGVKGFRVNKLDVSGVDAEIMLGIKNPNSFGFSIYRSKFDVTYNGVSLGTARLKRRVFISGNAEKAYPFKLKSNFKDASLTDIMKILGSGRGTLQVKGDLKAGKFLLRKKFPIDLKERVSLDK